jgi:hypothetical protein
LLPVCTDINFLSLNIKTIKENTEDLLVDSRGTGLEVNAEKTKYMFTSHDQNSRQNCNIKTAKNPMKM